MGIRFGVWMLLYMHETLYTLGSRKTKKKHTRIRRLYWGVGHVMRDAWLRAMTR